MTPLDIDIDKQIDPHALDTCWLEQANLVGTYGRAYAKAVQEAERADELVKGTRSRLILRVRKDPDGILGMKATDALVEAYYRDHPDYIAAKVTAIAAWGEARELEYALKALHDRRVALENLVTLLGRDYFAAPRSPRDLGHEWEQKAAHEKASEAIKQHTQRRRRQAP